MEALLEKEGKVENWNDDRMDELSRRMDAGFDQAVTKAEAKVSREEIGRRFDHLDYEVHRVSDRLDRLFYGISFFSLALILNLAAEKL
jgi:hypothetical protein